MRFTLDDPISLLVHFLKKGVYPLREDHRTLLVHLVQLVVQQALILLTQVLRRCLDLPKAVFSVPNQHIVEHHSDIGKGREIGWSFGSTNGPILIAVGPNQKLIVVLYGIAVSCEAPDSRA